MFLQSEILGCIGTLYIVSNSCKLAKRIVPQLFPLHPKFIQKNYKWALISGASDGIGKQFAQDLIQQNVNCILLGKDPLKLLQLQNDLQQLNDKTQCKIIIANFSNENVDLKNNFEDFKNIDLLINCVGTSYASQFEKSDLQIQQNLIKINCFSVLTLSQLIIQNKNPHNHLQIINVSSIVANSQFPYLTSYSASKSFINQFSKSLNSEQIKNVSILNVAPFYVSTKMTNYQKNFITISTKQFTLATFKHLQFKKQQCSGHWKHELLDIILSYDGLFKKFLTNYLKNYMDRIIIKIEKLQNLKQKRQNKTN